MSTTTVTTSVRDAIDLVVDPSRRGPDEDPAVIAAWDPVGAITIVMTTTFLAELP